MDSTIATPTKPTPEPGQGLEHPAIPAAPGAIADDPRYMLRAKHGESAEFGPAGDQLTEWEAPRLYDCGHLTNEHLESTCFTCFVCVGVTVLLDEIRVIPKEAEHYDALVADKLRGGLQDWAMATLPIPPSASDRLRRMADECEALISILEKGYMGCTPENVIDCLQHIVRVAKGEDR